MKCEVETRPTDVKGKLAWHESPRLYDNRGILESRGGQRKSIRCSSRHGAVDYYSQWKKFPSVKWKAKRGTTGNKRGYWESGMAADRGGAAASRIGCSVHLVYKALLYITVHLVVSSNVCCAILLLLSPPRYKRIFIKTNTCLSIRIRGVFTSWWDLKTLRIASNSKLDQYRKLNICVEIYYFYIYIYNSKFLYIFLRKWILKNGLDRKGKNFIYLLIFINILKKKEIVFPINI